MYAVMRLTGARTRAGDESGITIILMALAMVAMLVMVALVIDLSNVRSTRQTNKSGADFATTAGLRALETAEGIPRPWGGVCAALTYLKLNDADFSSLVGTYKDGLGNVTASADPCQTSSVEYQTLCKADHVPPEPDHRTTWAWFTGTTPNGRLQVDIRSGYVLPDPDFSEDAGGYSGDIGDPLQQGCDQLAVIIRERDSAFFGGIADRSSYSTQMRSVGRVKIGDRSTEAVALLLLEQTDCGAVETQGNSTSIYVRATEGINPATGLMVVRPGLIQSNSIGSTSCSGSRRVIEGSSACYAASVDRVAGVCTGSGPSIVAESAASDNPGRLGVRAVVTNPSRASTSACTVIPPASPPSSCTVSPVPTDRGVVSRLPVDSRFMAHVRTLKSESTQEMNRDDASAATAGYAVVSGAAACATLSGKRVEVGSGAPPAGTVFLPSAKVFLNCDFSPTGSTVFGGSISDVVVKGSLSVSNGTSLRFEDVRRLYVDGSTSGNPSTAIDVKGEFFVNAADLVDSGSQTACDRRFLADRTSVTQVSVGNGGFVAGTNSAKVHLCNTFVFLGAKEDLPATNGVAPYNNAFHSLVSIGAGAQLDWRAPNQTDNALDNGDTTFLPKFEDLALWSEYGRSSGSATGIGGQGKVVVTGVFFMPNANPFNLSGGGFGVDVPADAQFIVRKLTLSGTVHLQIAPNPNNSVPTPKFESFGLVR